MHTSQHPPLSPAQKQRELAAASYEARQRADVLQQVAKELCADAKALCQATLRAREARNRGV